MSTRFLGLLTTTAAVSVTLTAGMAAASASAAAPPPSTPDPAPAAAPQADSSGSSGSSGKAGKADSSGKADDLAQCRDADCDVTIRDGQTITLDKKFGLDPIHIKIDKSRVTFASHGPENNNMKTTIDADHANTSATYKSVTFSPHLNKDGTMNLKVSHN